MIVLCTLVLSLSGGCGNTVGCTPLTPPRLPEATGLQVEVRPPATPTAPLGEVRHHIDFADAATRYITVSSAFSTQDETLTVMMPVWTPGSYMVREYARQVEGEEAFDTNGAPLALEKIAKNRWRVHVPGPLPATVVIRYRVYAAERSVRTSFVDSDMAVLNGASVFLTPVGESGELPLLAHRVTLAPLEGWRCASALREVDQPVTFTASSFDELIDSPIVCGDLHIDEFEAHGIPHRLVTVDGANVWDHERAVAETQRIVDSAHRFWRVVDYDRYTFFNVLGGGGGGLEHSNSTLFLAQRNANRDDESARKWMGLVSHEFFHTWNVKRLKPRALIPFDYENEVYLRELWIAEGITAYYDDLLLRRAGLIRPEQYLETLSEQIRELQHTPGRQVQTLSDSSFDAWIKLYRSDEHTDNSRVNYYTKGAVVAFLLDAQLRKHGSSLDDVMRTMYDRFRDTGYDSADFEAVASELANRDLSAFFDKTTRSTDELDYDEALAFFGLRFAPPTEAARVSLGIETRTVGERLFISEVSRAGDGELAGLNVDDELLAVDGERVTAADTATFARFRVRDTVELVIARRGRLRTLNATFSEPQEGSWKLEVDPSARTARIRRDAWLEQGS